MGKILNTLLCSDGMLRIGDGVHDVSHRNANDGATSVAACFRSSSHDNSHDSAILKRMG